MSFYEEVKDEQTLYHMSFIDVSKREKVGDHSETPEVNAAKDAFRRIAFGKQACYRHQALIADSHASEMLYTKGRIPTLTNDVVVPPGDFLAKTEADYYYVSIDPAVKIGWGSNTLQHANMSAHVAEVLTDQASMRIRPISEARGYPT